MNHLDRELQQEKKLDRRSWIGWLLMIALIVIYMGGTSALLMLIVPGLARLGAGRSPAFYLLAGGLIVILLVLTVITVVLFFMALRWITEGQRRNFDRGTAVLQSTLPGAVSEQEVRAARSAFSFKTFGGALVLLVAAFLVIGIARFLVQALLPRLWPGAPELAFDVARWLVILAALFTAGWAANRQRLKRVGEAPVSWQDFVLRAAGTLFYLAFTFLPLFGLFPLFGLVRSSWIFPLALVLFVFGYGALNMIYLLVPFWWALAPVRRSDYEGTVRRAAALERVHVFRGAFLNLRGFAFLIAGRYEEARELLQAGIRATRSELAAGGADGLDNIGCILLAQGQAEEAIKMFEGAIAISPKHVDAYNNLAQALLTLDREPGRALELADRALSNYRSSLLIKLLERYQSGSILATRAWALAKLGRFEEAYQMSEQALASADRGFLPEYAALLYRLGYVDLLLGHPERSVLRWREAQRLDPNGPTGRRAEEALKSL